MHVETACATDNRNMGKDLRLDTPLSLRCATADDAMRIFEWQCSPGTRTYARNPAPPTLTEHLDWFAKKLSSPDCRLWIAVHNGAPCGFVRLDRLGDEWAVSIAVAPHMRGHGLGTAMLAAVEQLNHGAKLVADVLPENEASHALFRAAGYRYCTDRLYRKP